MYQVLHNLTWLALALPGGLGHAEVPPHQQNFICGCFCDIRSCDAHPGGRMDLHPRNISKIPFYSPALEAGEIPNATTIQVTAPIYLRDWSVFCECHTQNYCYYIIWGEWGLKLIYLDLSEPAKEFKLSTDTHTNLSTESYREKQNLVLRLTWKEINFFFPFHILIAILLPYYFLFSLQS